MYSLLSSFSIGEYIVGVIVFIVVTLVLRRLRKWSVLPPGPWGLPIVGYLPFLGTSPHLKLTELSHKYGKLFSIKMGQWTAIVLNDYDIIHEALQMHSSIYAGRPPFYSFQSIRGEKGASMAFMNYNASYKLQRKCAVECLNLFLKNKDRPIEDLILSCANTMVDNIIESGSEGKAQSPHNEIKLAGSSMIFDTCYGATDGVATRDSERFLKYLEQQRFFLDQVGAANFVDMMPWLKHFISMRGYHQFNKDSAELIDQIEQNHLTTYDPNHTRDCLDAGITVSNNVPRDEKISSEVDDEDIRSGIHNLVAAGVDTLPTAVEWAVMFFAAYPAVQKRIQEEVDDVIGNREPCYEDARQMPYLEVTCFEILRYSSIIPLLLPHYTLKDTKLKGFEIPKDTLILVNAYASNHSEHLWENPYDFNPDRFIDSDGKVDSKMTDKVLAFGLGKRRCPGEFTAKMELFLFLSVMMQKCEFRKNPADKWDWDGEFGLTLWPKPFEVFCERRK